MAAAMISDAFIKARSTKASSNLRSATVSRTPNLSAGALPTTILYQLGGRMGDNVFVIHDSTHSL